MARIRMTIGTKIVGIIAALLGSSITGLVVMSSSLFMNDSRDVIQEKITDTARALASQVEIYFQSTAERLHSEGVSIVRHEATPAKLSAFLDLNPELLGFQVMSVSGGRLVSTGEGRSREGTSIDAVTDVARKAGDFLDEWVLNKENVVAPVKLPTGEVGLLFAFSLLTDESGARVQKALISLIQPKKLTNVFSENNSSGTNFLVDRRGRLIMHTDSARVLAGENVKDLGIVAKMLKDGGQGVNNGQTRYLDPKSSQQTLGAYRSVGFAGLSVVSDIPEARAVETAVSVREKSIYVAVAILCLAFAIGYLFSFSISRPLQRLEGAAHDIQQGNFRIDLQAKGTDEVASLSRAFVDMAKGLEERDRVKATFSKFHSKEIAEKLLSGEVSLGGERKGAVIFFSDVRGFTGMSESMQPEQVVEMLNEYMTRMVSVITRHNGVVDKYVGDAIMALWGVPLAGENDALSAVRACLEMREELSKLNELRIGRGQVPLKIGMGLNFGEVIAGNIGSEEKMEYTVIGDSVNLASRIESMTKEYGTDLLISDSILERVQGQFVIEKCKSAKVKGKAQAISIYKVRGRIVDGVEQLIETPYSSYASEKSDKAVHDEPAPEAVQADLVSLPRPPAQKPVAVAPQPAPEPVHEIPTIGGFRFGGTQPKMTVPPPFNGEKTKTTQVEPASPQATGEATLTAIRVAKKKPAA